MTGNWTNYSTIDGLANNHVTTLLIGADEEEIWFGTRANGVTRYRRQRKEPETFILPPTGIDTQPEFDFRVTALSAVDFRFAGSDLNTPRDQLRFSYKLDNQDWSAYTSDDFARVLVDTIGLHTFHVKAIDRDKNEDPWPATLCFYKVDPDTGIYTTFIDTSHIHLPDSIKIKVYWPPNQSPNSLQVSIIPVLQDSLRQPALLAYDLTPMTTDIHEKGVILSFEFPVSAAAPDEQFSIHRDLNSQGRADRTIIGGTQQIRGGRVTLTTAINQFGRYAVRTSGTASGQLVEAKVNAQPRIFSPLGGGHGPQTTLSFQLDKGAYVRVRVYNLAGRLVDTVWDGMLNAGVNAIAWNGRDRDRQICPTGLYILTIESQGFQSPPKPVKVMVLNK